MNLAELLNPWVHGDVPNVFIQDIQNDSRLIKSGDLFIAYPGAVFDGRSKIEEAIQKGASAVVYDSSGSFEWNNQSPAVPSFPIANLYEKLGHISARFFQAGPQDFSITGVTGTNGKTTIAYQLTQAYDHLHQRAAYIGTLGQGLLPELKSLNNTTPDALILHRLLHAFKKQGVRHISMEVSSHALAQQRVDTIPFTQAIYTNLTHEHLDYHGSLQSYAEAKAKLFGFDSIQSAIINLDDPFAKTMINQMREGAQLMTYGKDDAADVRLLNQDLDFQGTRFSVSSPWGRHELETKLLGDFNVYNVMALFSSLMSAGYEANDVIEAVRQLKAVPGRMEVVSQTPLTIVDYAHTPDALENALKTLAVLKKGKLCVVFGCGGDRDKQKRPMMGKLAAQYADEIIITSDNPRTEDPFRIIHDIKAGITKMDARVQTEADRAKAIASALNNARENDIVFIAGKGHENYQILGQEKKYFSDQEVARDCLKNKKNDME